MILFFVEEWLSELTLNEKKAANQLKYSLKMNSCTANSTQEQEIEHIYSVALAQLNTADQTDGLQSKFELPSFIFPSALTSLETSQHKMLDTTASVKLDKAIDYMGSIILSSEFRSEETAGATNTSLIVSQQSDESPTYTVCSLFSLNLKHLTIKAFMLSPLFIQKTKIN